MRISVVFCTIFLVSCAGQLGGDWPLVREDDQVRITDDAGTPSEPPPVDDASTGRTEPDPPRSSPDASPDATPDATPDPTPDPTPGPTPFPTGPYGTTLGSTIDDFSFTRADGTTVTMADLRADRSIKAIVWISGTEWCSACISEIPDLVRLHNDYAARGVLVMETLFQNRSHRQYDYRSIPDWVSRFSIPYSVFSEPNPGYGHSRYVPQTWIIDAETMRVERFSNGFGRGRSTLDSVLSASPR